MVSEAIARSDNVESIYSWIEYQLNIIKSNSIEIHNALVDKISEQFAVLLPLLLFTAPEDLSECMELYEQKFPSMAAENTAIRHLLASLLSIYGNTLFSRGQWDGEVKNPERYTTPDSCAIVKLGITLNKLAAESKGELEPIFQEWVDLLRSEVLRKLPERIKRGFAPHWPLFEDIIISILHCAEWLIQSQPWQIIEHIKDSASRPKEQLTANQLILAGALVGYTKGYQSVSIWIKEQAQRRLLSEQAIRFTLQALKSTEGLLPGIDPIVFYSSQDGNRSTYSQPFLSITNRDRLEARHGSDKEMGITVFDRLDISLGNAFQVQLEFRNQMPFESPYFSLAKTP